MPQILVIRLHPVTPISGTSFSDFLTGLKISAFDLSVGHPIVGQHIGDATFVAPAAPPIPDPSTTIVQHYTPPIPPLPLTIYPESEATAVIAITLPAGYKEYATADIRLEISRSGTKIASRLVYYDVNVVTVGALPTPPTYPDLRASAVGIYLPLPRPLSPNLAQIDLSQGQVPDFESLKAAVQTVLAADQGPVPAITDITPAQATHIANEIIWGSLDPLPAPPALPTSGATGYDDLGALYTDLPNDGTIGNQLEQNRQQFEGNLNSYYATHNANVDRLARYTFALSCAMAGEQMSIDAAMALMVFPVNPGVPSPTTTISEADVVLVASGGGALMPAFRVPAEYFYALGVMLPLQMSAKQRYQLACRDNEERTLPALTAAVDAGTISDSLAVNPAQAARRIAALVPSVQYDATAPFCEVDATLTPLINDWLAYPSAASWRGYYPGDDTAGFWTPEIAAPVQPNAYLSLDLAAVTNDHKPLIAAIRAIPVTSVSQLSLMSVTDWKNLFGTPPNTALLPPFTAPGTAQARVAAFIRHAQKFFAVGFGIAPVPSAAAPPTPVLDLPTVDVITDWVSAYQGLVGGTFSFGAGALVDANVTAAAQTALPGDPSAQAWLVQRVTTLNALCQLASVASNVMPPVPSLAFSIAEALYARGFTSAADINRLSQTDFADAMRGTVAFDQANAIWSAAGGINPPAPPPSGPFQPVNPGGLENCVPPCYLSPTGTVEYLHELLRLSENSTCATPAAPPDQGRPTLEEAIAARRSDPGLLDVSAANAMTPLPLVDIVIEQLENLVAPPASGGVYNTAEHHLKDHKLCSDDECADVIENTDKGHPPASLFRALPEFNSPATPVANRAAYDALKTDFSSPALPYAQPLDVNRAYLDALSSCRFAAMRSFRKEITEFALDPTIVAPTFQSHLWRYPVKIDIGIEYLGINPEEYELLFTKDIALVPTSGQLVLYELYGFPVDNPGGFNWVDVVLRLPEFLKRTGLTHCELVELQKSNCFRFAVVQQQRPRNTNAPAAPAGTDATDVGDKSGSLPDCEPCCPEHYRIAFQDPKDPLDALRFLAVYLRLWRKLQTVCGARYTFTQLCDICEVLQLFIGGSINPDFIRQLVSFQILRDQFSLRLTDGTATKGAHGADRTHVLALWKGPSAAKWKGAVRHLVDRVMRYAQTRIDHCPKRPPHFIKLLVENLDPLAELAGFSTTVAKDSWHFLPTYTLRFAEVLAKVTASRFGIGELLYLFSEDTHLDGDDPFPLQDASESLDNPFDLPEEEPRQTQERNADNPRGHSLNALRKKLLALTVDGSEIHDWTWHRIESALKKEFGYAVPPGGTDYLTSLGKHFFPRMLERAGVTVGATDRQYRTPLTTASADMWNTPAEGPFRFDAATNELCTQLPLTDRAVIEKLVHIRDLTVDEQHAVQNLYAMPRVDLAPFAMLFPDFAAAEKHLIAEPDEEKRWHWFLERFALMVKRCHVIAAHLVGHVGAVASASFCGCTDAPLPHETQTAWLILQHLFGDENRGLTSWENDSGAIPDVMWKPLPSGGAFAALLGLVGTGLMGEFHTKGGELVWRELRANMRAFDTEKSEKNAPLPTILPALDLSLSPEQLRLLGVRNGFAIQNRRGTELGGAAGFHIKWHGVLMIDEEGRYHFEADVPRRNAGKEKGEGGEDEHERIPERRWRVILSRGQKTWAVLSHHWKDEHGESESTLRLKSGAYNIEVEFFQNEPQFAGEDDVRPLHTGFEVKYSGADTRGQLVVLPLDKLFCVSKDEQLIDKMSFPKGSSVAEYLYLRYTSTLRDIRRTYQRAFKALLFTHRFALTGHPTKPFGQSELGYMFGHADLFAGVSYYQNPGFVRHAANFDMNLLPLLDYYKPPSASQDQRTHPSSQRKQALFDWWERMFDYTRMRGHEKEDESGKEDGAHARPVWLLFEEAAEKQPDNPAQLLRHLDVDLDHAPCVLSYFSTQTTHVYKIVSDDLKDDRWAIRVWHANQWIDELIERCPPNDIRLARPDLWASDDPGALVPSEAQPGNFDLVRLFENAMIEPDEPDLRRYDDLRKINDCLREHARAHLLAYLCGMNRVPLPWGGHAKSPEALSALLLIDVEAGFCERASRIEEGITAVQTFVQRARLGLEDWTIGPSFLSLWKNVFASYKVWESCRCRTLYRENWIAWDELRKARRIEAFQFLEDQLRRSTLTLAAPGGLEYWAASLPPSHPAVELLQRCTPSALRSLTPPREGLGVLGTPERDARPSWLAPDAGAPQGTPQGANNPPPTTIARVADTSAAGEVIAMSATSGSPAASSDKLPLWIEAAIRLGVRFIRVAAGGVPPAAAAFVPSDFHPEPGCCTECGCAHPPLVDEYYFWLLPAQTFEEPLQDEYYDPSEQVSRYWHDPQQLPTLLDWKPESAVRLAWCRVHNGEFKQPRHSSGLVKLSVGATPDLTYVGRLDDSLTFAVTGGIPPTPAGYNGADAPGFRYDMAVESCVTLPLVQDPTPVKSPYPARLPAYPYFVFVEPGERLFIESMFSPSIAIADALRCHCHFEPALKWYELVRNPLQSDNMWMHCGTDSRPGGGTVGTVDVAGRPADVAVAEQPAAATHLPSTDSADVPGQGQVPVDMCCDSTKISAQTARDRAIVLAYVETLVEWARALMRKNSRESAQQARLVLDTASTILGPCPPTVRNHVKQSGKRTVATFVPLNPPLNPQLMQLYCHVRDGLSLVHRCLSDKRLRNPDVAGSCGSPYWGQDPCCCDAAPHRPCDEPVCCEDWDWCHPPTQYRFVVLMQKARESVGRLREMGAALLSAFERGDGEYLAQMHARHETELADMTVDIRQQQWREADWQVQALRKGKEVQQTNRRYTKRLIDVGLINGELDYQDNMNNEIGLRSTATEIEAVAEAMELIPDLFVGFPCEETWLPLGTKLAGMFKTIARITNEIGEIAGLNAQLDLTQGGWQRRLDEWVHQVEVLDLEIEQMEIQILAAERKANESLLELNLHQQSLEQSRERLNLLRDKFTSHELWLYLQKEGMAMYWQMYELAQHVVREAQRAFNFELGFTGRNFLPCESWNGLHEGLLAGDKLQLALDRMEKEYLRCHQREYELTKHVSLALHFPLQFLQLRLTGYCEIEIPEWMFDMDYPGQYMRRLKNVSVTIPCVTGPYTGVHCKLTLLHSWTRIDPCLPCPVTHCCSDKPKGACGCRHPSHEHYEAGCCDPRGVKLYGAREAIATSSGRNDGGLFELNFHDDRHLPFEYAGAVSCWRIELPQENNNFDLDTLTDTILHLNYTSREGGPALRDAARAAAREKLPGNGWVYLDVHRDFPDAWEKLRRSRNALQRGEWRSRVDEEHPGGVITLPISRRLFPYLPGDPSIKVDKVAVLFDSGHCCEQECPRIEECPCVHEAERGSHLVEVTVDHPDSECSPDELEIECKSSVDWPRLYHGSGEIRIAPLDNCHPDHTMTLTFAGRTCGLERVFVLYRYEVIERCCETVRPSTPFDVHEGGCHDCA